MGQRTVERDLIRLLDPSPGGKTLGDTSHRNTRRGDHLGKIVRGGFPLHIGTKGKDHFLGTFLTESLKKFPDAQMLRPHPVQRRELTPKGMVSSTEHPGALKGQNVGCRLHDTEFPTFPGCLTAECAFLLLRKESAEAAGTKGFARPSDGTGQLVWLGIGRAEHPEGNPLRTSWSDPRQTPQLLHQLAERLGVVEGGHGNDEG